jgi:Glyoxalase-like domain
MLTTVELTLDCADAPALAEFWKLAAGYVHHPPPYATMEEWQAHQARLQTSPKGVWWALRSFAPLLHGPHRGAMVVRSPAVVYRRRRTAPGRRRNRSHRVPLALRRGVAGPGGRGPGAGGVPG